MKRIALVATLLIMALMPVSAQSDEQALVIAIQTIVNEYGISHDSITREIITEVYDKSKKSAYLTSHIAKAYYYYSVDKENRRFNERMTHRYRDFSMKDTAQAFKYIRMAIRKDPKYAYSYALASDILDYEGDTNAALAWLRKGSQANPKDSTLFIAEARIIARNDVDAAYEVLQRCKASNPSFQPDLYMARIYSEIDIKGNQYLHEVATHYARMDMDQLNLGDMETYAMSLYYSNQNDKCNEVSAKGLERYPRSLAFNRFYLRTLIPMQKYSEALTAYDNLLKAEKAILENRDSLSYAAALSGTGQYDQGFRLFNEILAKPQLSELDRSAINTYVDRFMAARVKECTDRGDFLQAVAIYEPFVEERRKMGILDDRIMNNYATIYFDWGQKVEGDEREEKYKKADEIWKEAIALSTITDNKEIFLFKRVQIYFQLDGKAETGVAIPAIHDFETAMLTKSPLSDYNKTCLTYCYQYMMYYYTYTAKNYDKSRTYVDKMLYLDPTNDAALKMQVALSKRR